MHAGGGVVWSHLSTLQLECSGPCPSKPWGSSITSPDCRSHLASPAAMNWSIITYTNDSTTTPHPNVSRNQAHTTR